MSALHLCTNRQLRSASDPLRTLAAHRGRQGPQRIADEESLGNTPVMRVSIALALIRGRG